MSKENADIKYEWIPYDGFIGSKEFDFDKAIYDLNSQIEFGAKLDLSLDSEGYERIEKISFEAYNESTCLIETV